MVSCQRCGVDGGRRRWCGLVATLLVLAHAGVHAQDVIQVGTLLPLTGIGCASGVQFQRAAQSAVTYAQSQSWWTDTGMHLQLNIMNANTSFLAYKQAREFASTTCAAGSACVRAAIVGPWTSDATEIVSFVARQQQIPLVGFSATSPLLMNRPYFVRTCPSDSEGALSLYKAVKYYGWDQVAIVHVNNEYSRAYELELQDLVQQDSGLSVPVSARFTTGSVSEMRTALGKVKDSLTRVVIAIMFDSDVDLLFEQAASMGMIGKGWTWLGTEWMSAFTFSNSGNEALLYSRLNGAAGTMPAQGRLSSFNGGELNSFTPTSSDLALCPQLSSTPSPSPPAVFVDYVFDAVLSVAWAAATARKCTAANTCTVPFNQLTPAMVYAQLIQGGIPDSPLTGPIAFSATTGDRVREDITFDLVNVYNSEVKIVGTRTGVSDWTFTTPVVWSSGSTEVPSDRVLPQIGTIAGLFSVALVAMAASIVLGYTIQRSVWVSWFPSSGVVVLVGMVIGIIVQAGNSDVSNEFQEAIRFDTEFFSLVFLPIIIFQSGYSLKKHPFFSQLGSILMFALVGTLISTMLVGLVLYQLGQGGIVTRMSVEEALAFGALISAIDPVSTLAQFGSIKVPLSLGALVYGESVINDAISIVLYRMFTGFLTEEVTSGAIMLAVLTLVGMLVGSVLIGFVVTLLAGFTLRMLDLGAQSGVHVGVAETGILIVFSYASFTITEAAHLSGIVASLACGISMNHYLKKVLSKEGQALSLSTFMVMADIAETIVFLQVGLNVPLYASAFSFSLTAFTLVLCMAARFINIFPLSFVLNLGRKEPIPGNHQAILWLSGLRGAIAYALSVQFPSHLVEEVTNTTAIVVVFTILVFGGSTRPMLKALDIKLDTKPPTHAEELALTRKAQQQSRFKAWIAAFDTRVIRRIMAPPPSQAPKSTVHESPLHTALDSSGEDDAASTAHVRLEMRAKSRSNASTTSRTELRNAVAE